MNDAPQDKKVGYYCARQYVLSRILRLSKMFQLQITRLYSASSDLINGDIFTYEQEIHHVSGINDGNRSRVGK